MFFRVLHFSVSFDSPGLLESQPPNLWKMLQELGLPILGERLQGTPQGPVTEHWPRCVRMTRRLDEHVQSEDQTGGVVFSVFSRHHDDVRGRIGRLSQVHHRSFANTGEARMSCTFSYLFIGNCIRGSSGSSITCFKQRQTLEPAIRQSSPTNGRSRDASHGDIEKNPPYASHTN